MLEATDVETIGIVTGAMKESNYLQMSLWDFSGDPRHFLPINPMLTPHGPNIVVFSLLEWTSKDTASRSKAHLRFWLSALRKKAKGASIAIVGTHHDKVKKLPGFWARTFKKGSRKPQDIQKTVYSVNTDISNMLCEMGFEEKLFKVPYTMGPQSPWSSTAILTCNREDSQFDRDLVYFPVDNTKNSARSGDPQVQILRQALGRKRVPLDQKVDIDKEVPMSWAALADDFAPLFMDGLEEEHRGPCMSTEALSKQGIKYGVKPEDVPEMISTLARLGIIVWIDTFSLRDYVVTRPKWLVRAVADLLRLKDRPKGNPFPTHSEAHYDYIEFIKTGMVTDTLLGGLASLSTPCVCGQEYLLKYLQHCRVLGSDTRRGTHNFFPSLLPVDKKSRASTGWFRFEILCDDAQGYTPQTLFDGLLCDVIAPYIVPHLPLLHKQAHTHLTSTQTRAHTRELTRTRKPRKQTHTYIHAYTHTYTHTHTHRHTYARKHTNTRTGSRHTLARMQANLLPSQN